MSLKNPAFSAALPRSSLTPKRDSWHHVKPSKKTAGFSLIEVLVSMGIFCVTAAGIMGVLMKSYEISDEARYRDCAREVLRTYSEQFLRLNARDDGSGAPALFTPTFVTGPTSQGLTWGGLNLAVTGNTTNMDLKLSNEAYGLPATVTRDVSYLNPFTYADVASTRPTGGLTLSAGYVLRGTFAISYTFKGKTFSQQVVVMRVVDSTS